MTSYLIAIVMFIIHINIFKIVIVEICMTLTLTFMRVLRLNVHVYTYDFTFDGRIYICNSFLNSKIFAVEMCMALTVVCKMGQGQL